MPSKRCKIHYRRLRRDNGQFIADSLSAAITTAMGRTANGSKIGEHVRARLAGVPRQEDYQRVVNNLHVEDGLVFGDLCLFSPGRMQALLSIAEEEHRSLEDVLKSWNVLERRAPDGTEYLHGMSYWMVTGDHFYQIPHVSLPPKAFEEYLTWLLRDQAKVLVDGHYVELQSEFDRAQIGDDLGDVRAIEIGGLVPETVRDDPVPKPTEKVVDVEAREHIGDKVLRGFAAARQILTDLLGPIEAQRIIDTVPPEASLEVTVNIGYRSRKRRIEKQFMSDLASGLRHLPDGDIRVRGRDGQIKGDDARLSADMSVKRVSETSSLLDLEDALTQMKEVHRRFLHDGKLRAEHI